MLALKEWKKLSDEEKRLRYVELSDKDKAFYRLTEPLIPHFVDPEVKIEDDEETRKMVKSVFAEWEKKMIDKYGENWRDEI